MGSGPVGICTALCSKYIFKAKHTILIDIDKKRLEKAQAMKAADSYYINDEHFKKTLLKLTNNLGADSTIECAGAKNTFK